MVLLTGRPIVDEVVDEDCGGSLLLYRFNLCLHLCCELLGVHV